MIFRGDIRFSDTRNCYSLVALDGAAGPLFSATIAIIPWCRAGFQPLQNTVSAMRYRAWR